MKYFYYILIFSIYFHFSSYSQLSPSADSLLQILLNTDDSSIDEQIDYSKKMLKIGMELDSLKDIRMSYDWLTFIHMNKGDYDNAYKYSDTLLFYSYKIGDLNTIYYANEFKFRISRRSKNHQLSLFFLNKMMPLVENLGDDELLYLIYYQYTETFIMLGRYDEANNYVKLAFGYSKKLDNKEYILDISILKIRILYNMGHLNESDEAAKEVLRLSRKYHMIYYIEKSYDWLIHLYYTDGDYGNAIKYAEDLLSWSLEVSSVKNIFYTYTQVIRLYENITHYNEALKKMNEMILWAEINGVSDVIKENYDWQIYVDYNFRDDKNILDYYLEKLDLDLKFGSMSYLAHDYFLIGTIYMNLKSMNQSIMYLNMAKEIYERYNDIEGLACIYHHTGIVYFDQNKFKTAIEYYKMAFNYYNAGGDINNMAISNCNIGSALEEIKNDSSIVYLNRAYELVKKTKFESTLCLIYSCLGDYYLWKKDFNAAYNYLQKGKLLADKNNMFNYLDNILESLSKLFANLGDYKKSFEYHKEYKILSDSLFDKEITSRAAELELQYAYNEERKIQSINLFEKEKKIQINRFFFMVTCLTLSFIFIIFYYLYRNRIKQDELKLEKLGLEKFFLIQELKYKEQELSTKISHLINKNELISNIIHELLEYKEKFKKENQKTVESIINELQFHINKEDWDEFELRFKQVHTGFYKNLSINFPSLTSNELKICAFIKLNMSTKDISSITNQTINSIEVARTRLRKKLKLSKKNTNLVEFLSQF